MKSTWFCLADCIVLKNSELKKLMTVRKAFSRAFRKVVSRLSSFIRSEVIFIWNWVIFPFAKRVNFFISVAYDHEIFVLPFNFFTSHFLFVTRWQDITEVRVGAVVGWGNTSGPNMHDTNNNNNNREQNVQESLVSTFREKTIFPHSRSVYM